MWSNAPPSSRPSVGDQFNNNANNNPYSRTAMVPKNKTGRTSADPWDWGWDGEESNPGQQQEDWNTPGWGHPNPCPPPPKPVMFPQSQKPAHRTPDLIPEKTNNNHTAMYPAANQRFSNVTTQQPSDFFENIDLVANNTKSSPSPKLYNPADAGRQQPEADPVFSYFQPQNVAVSQNNYFRQSNSPHDQVSFYQPQYQSQYPGSSPQQQYQQPNPPQQQYHPPTQPQQQYQPNPPQQQYHPPTPPQQQYQPNPLQQQYHPPTPTQQQYQPNPPPQQYQQPSPPQQQYQPNPPPQQYNATKQSYPPPPLSQPQHHSSSPPSLQQHHPPPAQPPHFQNYKPFQEESKQKQNYQPSPYYDNADTTYSSSQHTPEVENIEVPTISPDTKVKDESKIEEPDNQETVPDNEEQVNELPSQLANLRLDTAEPADAWNNTAAGWENQEVAPRCELDRNQYLETGQLLEQEEAAEPEVDNNDEGEPLPPPGLHRMVTGQVTDTLTQRSVVGQQSTDQRHVLGQLAYSDSSDISSLQRHVPGQTNHEDSPPLDPNVFQRMVPGQSSVGQQQIDQGTPLLRLIPGQNEIRPSLDTRMIPGQISDDESATIQDNNLERMVPGGLSEHELNNLVDDERMVPGGLSDMDQSDTRLIPGTGIAADNERQVTIGCTEPLEPVSAHNLVESTRRSEPALHRKVIGHLDNQSADTNRVPTTDREDEANTPRLQRMVLGQFREKGMNAERDSGNIEREDDSDSDYHVERRKHRHRKDSYEDEGRTRDYSSERDYRAKRDDREKYRKKPDRSYNRSPDYRSDQDEYEKHEYRDRDRRERPRDRRRRSPEYNYRDEGYYREDVRKHGRDRRDRYYDQYEEDHSYRENRSRPSSRTGSDYRRPVPRDYAPRNPYFPDPMNNYHLHYYQMQQYYENMRRNDPQAYALWYERYMAEKYAAPNNDRASVHSGRSSANIHDRNIDAEVDVIKTEDVSQRSTPAFYHSPHVRGVFNNLGQLVVIQPQNLYDNKATVDVCKLGNSLSVDNDDVRNFLQCPGPFIAGVTHKKTVYNYLKRQADNCRHSSEKLLYELICLVINLNGVVDMTDVATLLMDSYKKSMGDTDPYLPAIPAAAAETSQPQLSQHQVTCKFRDLLLEGNKTEALDWAMKNGDWGHALFLASKMDTRTHNNVMLRFANGLQANDPLQTLYQLMSDREPQAASCAADKRWGDWRPHLAMMLSNRTSNPELDRKAILSLGHSLGSRGRTFACHFCYLTAQLEFSSYIDKCPNKLVLLGSSPDHGRSFSEFATCRSIMLTICYEYAKQMSNKDFSIPTLRLYKYLLAVRLIDHNQFATALAYLELIARDILRAPIKHDHVLASHVIHLAEKIKFTDSSLPTDSDPSVEPDWLEELRHLEESSDSNYVSSNMSVGRSTPSVSETDLYNNGGEHNSQVPLLPGENTSLNYYEHQAAWSYQQPAQAPGFVTEQNVTQPAQNNFSFDYMAHNTNVMSPAVEEEKPPQFNAAPEPAPMISVKPGFGYYASTDENTQPQVKPASPVKAPPKPKPVKEKVQPSGSGWFGGIWDKLALRPKNQMKLPDDKNPSIVWDEKAKRWVNTDANGEDESSQVKPPPRMDETPTSTSATPFSTMPASANLPPAGPNKYKMQRGKGMRGNYIDVMNPSNKKPAATVATPDMFAPAVPQNLFIPAPITGNDNAPVDFISQSGPVSFDNAIPKHDDQLPSLSRSSSASSLSREVSYYMNQQKAVKRSRLGGFDSQPAAAPMFYNPSSFTS